MANPTTTIIPMFNYPLNLESGIYTYPIDDHIEVNNNSKVILDLSQLTYTINDSESPFKPIKAFIDWGDGETTSVNYSLNVSGIDWQAELNNWITEIGPHYYSREVTQDGNKIINVKIYDSANNIYELNIRLYIIMQNIYDLGIELNIIKSAFTEDYATILVKLESTTGDPIYNTNTPLISVLR